jgi:hypothetical protein
MLASFFNGLFAQENKSSVRNFINKSDHLKFVENWSTIAEFNSGIGEYVKFYPVYITDLKTGKEEKAFKVEMYIMSDYSNKKIYKTAYISDKEVMDFVAFIEKNIIPNLKQSTDKKEKVFYQYNAKELSFIYVVYKNSRIIKINLNSTDDLYKFWTKTQVKKIPKLLEILKTL